MTSAEYRKKAERALYVTGPEDPSPEQLTAAVAWGLLALAAALDEKAVRDGE
ncbi:hypothetical protein [Streptomyces pristinaespiralis]|uniref:hypothetical protein n=1 Tax=Streptomyces pristinaespiralis TaxID=38300 RepID=UPI003832F53B